MATLLIQVTVGPEEQTKACLAFLVASTALNEGHEVKIFLVGEAVRLLDPVFLDRVQGLGTGRLKDHFDEIIASNGVFFVSRLSSEARGYDDKLIREKPAQFALPESLVQLTMTADKTIVY